jgi:hypothetical protein
MTRQLERFPWPATFLRAAAPSHPELGKFLGEHGPKVTTRLMTWLGEFGPLGLSRRGIDNGKELLFWEDVQEIKNDGGLITVVKKGKWLSWLKVSVADVPNQVVFWSLVHDVLPGK